MGSLGTKHKATGRTYIFGASYRLHLAIGAPSVGPKRQRKAAGPSIQLDDIDRSPLRRPLHSPRTCWAKGKTHGNASYSSRTLTRLLQGAAAGAIVTLIVGFNWGGWVTGGTAKEMTERGSTAAVISALSPICVDKFQRSADATTNMTELRKVSSYQQGSFIEKGGWATLPGNDKADSAVASACANMLNSLK
jgi:hypothetical protein